MATYYVKSGVATQWVALTAYTTERVVPTFAYATNAAKGRVYECTTPGTSGAAQPAWNTTVGGTTADGTAVWTTRDTTTWANASPYLFYIVNYRNGASPQGGDIIYVSNSHAEVTAQTVNFLSSGSTTQVNILCGNDSAEPPIALATTATVTLTANSSISFLGFTYIYGISFNVGSTQAGTIIFNIGSTSGCKLYFDSCKLQLGTTGTGVLQIGSATAPQEITFDNTPVQFGSTASTINLVGSFLWKNTPNAILGSLPLRLFTTPTGSGGLVIINGVDLSASTGYLVELTPVAGKIYFQNCKVHANFLSNISDSIPSQQGSTYIKAHNCDSGATTNMLFEQDYYGTTRTETTLVRTGGASDGTTTISWKMISSSTTVFYSGLESPVIGQWQNTTGAAKTATIEILHDSATALTDAEVYAEVEYFATTNPGTSFANDRATDLLATPANQTTSAATWTTTGMANPNTQKLEVSFTPGMVGPIRVKVYLLKPSYTIYVDPLVTIA